MKRFLIVAAVAITALPQAAQADLIVAGIDSWTNAAAPPVTVVAGFATASATASASTGAWAAGEGGGNAGRGSSKDGTWGDLANTGGIVGASTSTAATADNFLVTNGRPSAEVTFTITNNGADDLDLNGVHFDAVAFRPNAPRAYAINVLAGSSITEGNVFTSADDAITHLGGNLLTDDTDPLTHDQHDDISVSLASLADNTLATGETAIIQVAFSSGTGSGGGHHLFLDNLAVSGVQVSAIPEPGSLALFGLSGMALAFRRRK